MAHVECRVLNESGQRRYGLRVHFEVRDALGQPVGSATDYLETLDPGQESALRALVIAKDARQARVTRVEEQ